MKSEPMTMIPTTPINEPEVNWQERFAEGNHHKMQRLLARILQRQKRETSLPSVDESQPTDNQQPQPSQESELRFLFCQAMYHTQAAQRVDALRCLLWLAPYDKCTIQALEQALQDKDPVLRTAALGEMSVYSSPLPEPLQKQLTLCIWDPNMQVRKAAVRAARHHPDPRLLPTLMGLLGTPYRDLYTLVVQSLRDITHALDTATHQPV